MEQRQSTAPTLRRVMRARDYFTLAFGSIVGVGWMVLLDKWLERGGPAGAMLGFLLGGLALVPVACVYGRLAERVPGSASEVAYTAAVFPRPISFATGWAMAFANAIVCPFEAVALGRIAAYLFPAMDSLELYRVAGQPVYLPHLLLGLAAAAGITWVNYRGIRHSTLLQNVTTFGLLGVFALFSLLGLSRGHVENLPPYFADQAGARGAFRSVLAVLQVVPYFLMGFETIPKCSEEAARDFDPRKFVRVMLWALGVATLFYVTVIAVVALLRPWQTLLKVKFPTAAAFEQAFGWRWLVRLIMLGVVLSLVKVFNGNFLAATRLLYAMGRRDLLGGMLGRVHPRHQTPFVAVAVVGGLTVLGTFLGQSVLDPISAVGSLCGAAVWLATALAFWRGAGGKPTAGTRALGLAGAAVAGLLLVIVAAGFGAYEWVALGGWAALGLALWLTRRPATEG
jgi:basic amino acid/polyamine antiporter, APA family